MEQIVFHETVSFKIDGNGKRGQRREADKIRQTGKNVPHLRADECKVLT